MATNVTHQMGLLNLISRIDRAKSASFEKGRQNFKRWLDKLSVYRIQAAQSHLLLPA